MKVEKGKVVAVHAMKALWGVEEGTPVPNE
jgi:hypothetical protein